MTLQRVCFVCGIWLAVVLLHLSIGHTVRWRRCGHSSRDNSLLIVGVCHLTNVRTYSHLTCPHISNNALTNVQNPPPPFLRFILSNNIAVHCILRGEYHIYILNNILAPPTLTNLSMSLWVNRWKYQLQISLLCIMVRVPLDGQNWIMISALDWLPHRCL